MTAWGYLIIAGTLEVLWALGLKFSEGFTRAGASVITVTLMIASFYFLARAVQAIPLGTAYAVWTGIGAVGTAAVGMAFLGEARDPVRLFCLALIIAGIIGLKMGTPDA